MDQETGISGDYLPMDPKRLLERFHTALNTRDITNLMMLLQVDFEQFWPSLPGRQTTGREAVRLEWERLFTRFPDFRADVLRQAIEGNIIWSEWRWQGSSNMRDADQRFDQVAVLIFGVEEGLLAWCRYYLSDVTGENSA